MFHRAVRLSVLIVVALVVGWYGPNMLAPSQRQTRPRQCTFRVVSAPPGRPYGTGSTLCFGCLADGVCEGDVIHGGNCDGLQYVPLNPDCVYCPEFGGTNQDSLSE